jgi:hypothetical protein
MDSLPVRSEEALARQYQKNRKGRTTHSTLREQAVFPTPKEMSWRTPSSSDGEGGIMQMREGASGKYKLRDHVAHWATPNSFCFQPQENTEQWEKRAAMQQSQNGVHLHKPVQSQVLHENERVMGSLPPSAMKLNPRWVEVLMGLPVGWCMPSCMSPVTIEPTNSDFSAMAS